ncbi:hypothetical protein LNP18_06185 [Leuconostoc citreum]|uniref:hypothetical protein n=1 Tax=Leuconostoc citreum TaxID=33964 RepID=UPI00200AFA87|nr:hypothetical protein [Leuconostoc citreum]MCK8605691.1 hypothetical protein [Leuconostoc citreum]
MAIVQVNYMETLVRREAIYVSDNLTDEQKVKHAVEIGKRNFFEENVILGEDDLDLREICAEYKKEETDYEAF